MKEYVMLFLKDLILSCEEDMRAGLVHLVAKKLQAINTAQISDPDRMTLARLGRRAGLINWGLKVLAPLVHPSRKTKEPCDQEKAEYAVLLQRSGVIDGALDLLKQVNVDKVPQSQLYQAFCYFNIWDYESAVPILESYVKKDLDAYSRLIGQVNLASAYVFIFDDQRALDLLERNICEARESKSMRLLANSLELRAQLHLRQRLLSAAEADLEQADKILGNQKTHDQLFVRQWSSLLYALKANDTFPLKEFKKEAIQRRNWESVREADLHSLFVSFDQETYEHLYYGTPWAGYRSYMQKMLGEKKLADHYIRGKDATIGWDIETGLLYPQPEIKINDRVHQLLAVLNKDFYRPKPVGAIFSEIFAGEHFDVFSSPNRVHQIVKRTRMWLEQNQVPAEILSSNNSYSFHINGALQIRVPRKATPLERKQVLFNRAVNQWPPGKILSNFDICEKLGISKTQVNEILKWANINGKVLASGKGRSTKYKLTGS